MDCFCLYIHAILISQNIRVKPFLNRGNAMTYRDALHYLDSLKPGGMKFGLQRMERMLALCGHPELRLRFLHIAGTNGKGSVARMIQAILTAAGYRTGLYSSPAVTGVRDTITVDGEPISGRAFADLINRLRSLQSGMGGAGEASEFELTTALAFLYFSMRHTDICVAECGLGGRDDATNIIPPPLAAVITPVSLDHTAVLGDAVTGIAANKCGIIKKPCAVITSPGQDDDALAVILETAARLGLTVRIPSSAAAPVLSESLGGTVFEYDGMKISLPLTGGFQRDNALTAIEAIRAVERAGFPVTKEQIISGLQNAVMPCRQEVVRRTPLIMIDGAHNPQGVAALAATLKRHDVKEVTLITGMLADKDAEKCMELLAPFCRRAVCCTPENPRALPAGELAEILEKTAPGLPVETADSPADALKLTRSDPSSPLLVAGSFYIAAALRPLLIV